MNPGRDTVPSAGVGICLAAALATAACGPHGPDEARLTEAIGHVGRGQTHQAPWLALGGLTAEGVGLLPEACATALFFRNKDTEVYKQHAWDALLDQCPVDCAAPATELRAAFADPEDPLGAVVAACGEDRVFGGGLAAARARMDAHDYLLLRTVLARADDATSGPLRDDWRRARVKVATGLVLPADWPAPPMRVDTPPTLDAAATTQALRARASQIWPCATPQDSSAPLVRTADGRVAHALVPPAPARAEVAVVVGPDGAVLGTTLLRSEGEHLGACAETGFDGLTLPAPTDGAVAVVLVAFVR